MIPIGGSGTYESTNHNPKNPKDFKWTPKNPIKPKLNQNICTKQCIVQIMQFNIMPVYSHLEKDVNLIFMYNIPPYMFATLHSQALQITWLCVQS